jgi:hypothetical protein
VAQGFSGRPRPARPAAVLQRRRWSKRRRSSTHGREATILMKNDKTNSDQFYQFMKNQSVWFGIFKILIFLKNKKPEKTDDKPKKLSDKSKISIGLLFSIQIFNFE